MHTQRHFIFSGVLVCLLVACGTGAPQATATITVPVSTNTFAPGFTDTPQATATLRPSATPNLELTQQADEFQAALALYAEKGYISGVAGETTRLTGFSNHWAGIATYNYWPLDEKQYADLVFSAHFEWKTSSSAADMAGCGVSFGIQEDGNRYTVVVDRNFILLSHTHGKTLTTIGAARGPGRTGGIPLPAKIDFVLIVRGQNVYVGVNNTFSEYILSSAYPSAGQLAYAILAGTNFGDGTACNMTNINFWIAE